MEYNNEKDNMTSYLKVSWTDGCLEKGTTVATPTATVAGKTPPAYDPYNKQENVKLISFNITKNWFYTQLKTHFFYTT